MADRLYFKDFVDALAPLDHAPSDEFSFYRRDGRWYQDNSSMRARGVLWMEDADIGSMAGMWCEHVAHHKANRNF